MQEADHELCGNATICDTESYGDTWVGVTGRVNNQPVVTKEGKLLLLVISTASGHMNTCTNKKCTGK